MSLYLLVRWLYVTGSFSSRMLPLRGDATLSGTLDTAGSVVADLLFTIVYFVLVDRAVTGFRALRPKFCSMYQPAFWRHERFWKVPSIAYIPMFNGTPFKGVIWRLLGVRIGRRVFDDGCSIIERSLVSVGSYCTLAAGSIIQCHSLEDGAFKSDHTVIGAGMQHRERRLRPLRGHDGRRLRARRRFLPDEGRGRAARRALGRQPRHRARTARPAAACPPGHPRHARCLYATNRSLTRWTSSKHASLPYAATAASGQRCSAGPRAAGCTTSKAAATWISSPGPARSTTGTTTRCSRAPCSRYLADDGVIHSLDMHTVAKREFLTVFDELILRPRQLDYRVQFPGPGGANAVEAALKLARKVTGRTEIITFTNSFHGMTLGALAVTGSAFHRAGAGIPLSHATPVPFGESLDSDGQVPDFQWLERLLGDRGSGLDAPAAAIVETVQGEGGINVASAEWLRRLSEPVPGARHPAHRRRRPDGLRQDRPVLQLRARGDHPGHRVPVEVHQRLRAAARTHADPARPGHLGTGRAQRHVPRLQPRAGDRHRRAARLLER